MDEVYLNQLAMNHITPCSECVGRIAVMNCNHLDERVYIIVDNEIIGPLHTVDCANSKDRKRLERRGLIAELDFKLAEKLNTIGKPIKNALLIIAHEIPKDRRDRID